MPEFSMFDVPAIFPDDEVLGRVPVYLEVPDDEVPEEMLQELGRTRLELLQKVQNDLPGVAELQHLLCFAEHDAISHFLLRVLCCGDGAATHWLLEAEEALMKLRWKQASGEQQCLALQRMNFQVSAAGVVPRWVQVTVANESMPCAVSMHFTALPPQLLAQRRAKLHRGMATVEREDFLCLLCQCFRRHLQTVLHQGAQHVEALLQDNGPLKQTVDALRPQLEPFLLPYKDGVADEVKLSLSNFQELHQKSFPPCMQYLVNFQSSGRHLKHLGRKQLRPLLREAGLPLDEALTWWRREFLRDVTVTQEAFESEHFYHIKHAYGMQGKRKAAYGWSCWKTLDQTLFPVPKAMEAHGCPFKSLPAEELRQLLRRHGGGEDALEMEVSHAPDIAAEQVYCGRVFQRRHPGSEFQAMKHPMQFLRRSRQYYADFSSFGAAPPAQEASSQVFSSTKENCTPNQKKPRICRGPLRVAQLDQFDDPFHF